MVFHHTWYLWTMDQQHHKIIDYDIFQNSNFMSQILVQALMAQFGCHVFLKKLASIQQCCIRECIRLNILVGFMRKGTAKRENSKIT